MTTEAKCGDDCKLVEMLATKTSKQQAMENAIAAVQTGNISQRGAAKQFKVNRDTLSRKLKETGNMAEIGHDTTQPESPPAMPKTADKAERDQWFANHQAGLSARKIAEKFGRSRLSITKEIKRREETEAQPEPTPTPTPTPAPSDPQPTPTPAPTPSVPSAGSSEPVQWEDDPCLDGWNGNLNELSQQIYRREVASSRSRVRMANELSRFKLELEKTMRAASNNHRTKAGKLLEADVKMVEATLQREGRPGIKETLERVLHEAERIQKFASETLRVLQLRRVDL